MVVDDASRDRAPSPRSSGSRSRASRHPPGAERRRRPLADRRARRTSAPLRRPARRRRPGGARRAVRDGRPPRRHPGRRGLRRRPARVRRPRGAARVPSGSTPARRLHQQYPITAVFRRDRLEEVDGWRRPRPSSRAMRTGACGWTSPSAAGRSRTSAEPHHLPPPPPRPPPRPPARERHREIYRALRDFAPAGCSPSCPSTAGAPTSPACASSSTPSCIATRARPVRGRAQADRRPLRNLDADQALSRRGTRPRKLRGRRGRAALGDERRPRRRSAPAPLPAPAAPAPGAPTPSSRTRPAPARRTSARAHAADAPARQPHAHDAEQRRRGERHAAAPSARTRITTSCRRG